MNTAIVAGLLLVLLGFAYQTGWSRSRALAPAGGGRLHSRPIYHGALTAIWALVPALLIVGLWALFGESASRAWIVAQLPPEVAALGGPDLDAAIRRIRQIESGFGVIGEVAGWENQAAQALYRRFGMAPVGVRKKYYVDEDALIMWAHEIKSQEFTDRLADIRDGSA